MSDKLKTAVEIATVGLVNEPPAINLDFDGTVVCHAYPGIGAEIGAVPVLRELVAKGCKLILFTMRSDGGQHGPVLTQAIEWFEGHGLPLYGIQRNPTQRDWTTSPKSYAPLMIDDSALGCPLKMDRSISQRPFVDWVAARAMLVERGVL